MSARGPENSYWWARVIDRWGYDVAISLAQRHAERRSGPDVIGSYLEWKRAQERAFYDAHPENRPTHSDYSFVVAGPGVDTEA